MRCGSSWTLWRCNRSLPDGAWLARRHRSPVLAARFRSGSRPWCVHACCIRPSGATRPGERWSLSHTRDRIGLYKALCSLGGARARCRRGAGRRLLEEARTGDPRWSPRQRSRRQLASSGFTISRPLQAAREAGCSTSHWRAPPARSRDSGTQQPCRHRVRTGTQRCRDRTVCEAIERAAALGRPPPP